MVKSLMLGVANASCVLCGSAFSGLVFNFENLPAVAVNAHLVSQTVAQATPERNVNRPTLKIGSDGPAVSELQAALKLLGYYIGAVDGVYQESTAIAVSQFQQAAGLNPDGIAGPATWNRLFPSMPSARTPSPTSSNNPASSFPVPSAIQTVNSPLNRPTTTAANSPTTANLQPDSVTLPILRQGMQGPAVAQLQERLRALGFLKGSADGVFGEATQTAVIAAQQNFNLQPDGIVGPATWRVLLR
jgi:peptidoglycan hydrolase-like protein with peptidoglycan-binding domain